jgi:hypothetical protein
VASDSHGSWYDPRTLAVAAWIFGCAAYYYARLTWVLAADYDEAIRDLSAQLARLVDVPGRGP